MSIRLQDINTTASVDLTDKVLITDGVSENLATIETIMGATHISYMGARLTTDPTVTLTGNADMIKCPLTATGLEVPSGASGMSISSGGVKVSAEGAYKVTASLYLSSNGNANGVYIWYGTTFTDGPAADTGATELCGVYADASKSAMKQVTGIVTNVPANTIFWLVGRSSTAASTAQQGWLLVERYA